MCLQAPLAHVCIRVAGLSRERSPARETVPIMEEHRVPVPTSLAGASHPARPVPTPVALDTLTASPDLSLLLC